MYEIFVRSFRDSNRDGIGDLNGILNSLDYLEDLGVDTIWITPIMPSPSYHGYDVIDYFNVNPLYGTLEGFKDFVEDLHERDFKLILDLPLNHTSVLHEWFEEKPHYYIWANENTNINERREWDGAFVWHPSKRGYYYGLFGSCMPDLDYSNPEVVDRAIEIVRFWTAMGVDGFRFDAAKHIHDDHSKNMEFWKLISDEVKKVNPSAILVAEVWDRPEIVKGYIDVLGYAFNFHVFGSLKKSVVESNPWPLKMAIEDVLNDFHGYFNFLSNHDMNRLASDIPDEKRRLFAYSILFTLPGIPVVYYGEELGVPGIYDPEFPENVVEPFPWCENPCCEGQTRWKSAFYTKPFHGYSVEFQMKKGGFLNKFKEVVSFRRENPWIDRARIENVEVEGSTLVYDLVGEKRMSVSHDFSRLETEIFRR